ncbi:MAG: hypothetical protein RLY31_15 [Bacteroidota bacterium]
MKEGFYEKIITQSLSDFLKKNEANFKTFAEPFNKGDGPLLIQRYFQAVLLRAFHQVTAARDEVAKEKLIGLTNDLISLAAKYVHDTDLEQDIIANDGKVLKALFRADTYDQADIERHTKEAFPVTGLSESALFNGSKHTPSLESELKKEMLTADETWWLVSFLKFEGVRLFGQVLEQLKTAGKKVKVICTVYMGATDLKAIDFLSGFSNVEIKISFNTDQERLHAKSYLFIRNSGFHTAYVGSSNMSRSALTNGLEWNLKVTQQEIPHIITKCRNTFETYWEDPNFQLYNPAVDRDKLRLALEKGKSNRKEEGFSKFFDLSPFPFQQQILDQLAKCRANGEKKNLVVAATGTGKTVMAAFDFKRYLKQHPRANFLFVAHRKEILKQARETFRHILKNNDFGDLWVDDETPSSYNQLFASIQTLNNRIEQLSLGKQFFTYLIIDEVHHSAASSYQRLLSYFQPDILLGLTATPERHDGVDITTYFGHSISAEIRLPDALNQKILCPFQYFGITDTVDISRVSWRKGRYEISALEKIYSENDRRVRDIIQHCDKYLKDYQDVRALGFCVSIKHAEFMSHHFNLKGIKAGYLHSGNSQARETILNQLKTKEINYLFVIDIFNEGVDIPEIDTLLFLRPTESLTIFLQQLGRGLRIHEDKTCLTVLDFVGQQHVEYSFEHKFRAMLGKTYSKVKDELEHDFPNLPLGCSIYLEKTAKEYILKNIQNSYRSGKNAILKAMDRFVADYHLSLTLENFCKFMDISLFSLYNTKQLFVELRNEYRGISFPPSEHAARIVSVLGRTWLSTDSEHYFQFLVDLVSGKDMDLSQKTKQQYLLMCYIDLFNKAPNLPGYRELYDTLRSIFSEPMIQEEVSAYLQYRISQLECIEKTIQLQEESVLKLHGRYTRNQILTALSQNTLQKQAASREGVYIIEKDGSRITELNTELFFVTFYKSADKFNASTMYDDYFINDELFHWQSQNSTSPESPVGKSYIEHKEKGKDILLFVREYTKDENKLTMAFVFCGKLHYVQHEGRKPMSIIWRMETPPPALLLNEGRKLGVG